ncbi:hypothetical protein BDQ17DRAFT_1541078 [Cyathus striatus]|nr:hypothetical protein BDQ17DRAFT_1541078 [Cyathus striatus]
MEPIGIVVCKSCKSPLTARNLEIGCDSKRSMEAAGDSYVHTSGPHIFPDSSERSRLTEDISLLDEIINNLSGERSRLKTRLNSLMPVVARLPLEVLSEVLAAACQTVDNGDGGSASEPHITPLFLGSVCKAWRSAAWSIPRIWTNCSLRLSTRRYHTQLSLLKEWLARAGSCLLTIKISARYRDQQKWALKPPVDLLRFVASYSRQWSSIDILISDSFLEHLSDAQGKMPMLTALRVRRIPLAAMAPVGDITIFSDSPQLMDVTYIAATTPPTTLMLPWHQITKYHLEKTTVPLARQVFQMATNLVFCKLRVVHGIFNTDDVAPFNMQSLEHLDVWGAASALLDAATLPSLQTLVCASLGSSFVSIASLLTRSHCQLQTLKLTGRNLVEPEIVTCLLQIPSLTALEVRDDGPKPAQQYSSQLLDTLAVSNEPFVPMLKSLSYVGKADVTEELLRNILNTRGQFEGHVDGLLGALKSVVITITDAQPMITFGEDMLKHIKKLREKGMEISFSVNDSELSY